MLNFVTVWSVICSYPTSHQYGEVCKAVLHTFPALRDRVVHDGPGCSLPHVSRLPVIIRLYQIYYISSIPAAHTEYSATNVIPPIGAIAAVKRLPYHISQFAPCSSQGGVTQKGNSGKFLIYPPFQRPTPSTPPPVLYHLLGLGP